MNLKDNEKVVLLTKYTDEINRISKKYEYPNNIKHLLYIIIPAFVMKYGVRKEHFILKCLEEIPIFITGKEDPKIQALYMSYPNKENDKIKTTKQILLNRYQGLPYMQLIDNLVHEFNHAINSFKNEVLYVENYFFLRTGLSTVKYNKKTMEKMNKSKSIILEEVINSKQTETIIETILELSNLKVEDIQIQNTLFAIRNSVKDKYVSSSYFTQKYYCQTLLDNKTFFLTLEDLRINGNIFDVESWFNNIYGDDKGYQTLTEILYDLTELQRKTGYVLFKEKKIRKMATQLMEISNRFNQNCNLK